MAKQNGNQFIITFKSRDNGTRILYNIATTQAEKDELANIIYTVLANYNTEVVLQDVKLGEMILVDFEGHRNYKDILTDIKDEYVDYLFNRPAVV